ncbi:HutD family protein [Microbacterium ureisolvens]|uniref:HutD family protein n=1 Tax=Microbacterium ureisolvens TaxID=2781186 RepID=A0ABS7I0U0_9MICO|nr:HutD family protein [Microbacterium ureisolvens]MBW9110719.1 HutD family protein [Microbacterium ureisolvens]
MPLDLRAPSRASTTPPEIGERSEPRSDTRPDERRSPSSWRATTPVSELADLDVVTPTDASPESWANGLGVTRVLAKRLAWRLSIAELRGRMPFSAFPGIDRVLIPLSAATLALTVDGVERRVTRERGIRFRGEARVVATADRGGVSVVNLMVKRGLAEPTYRVELHHGTVRVDPAATLTVLLAGTATVDDLPLPPGSALLQGPRERRISCDRALIARFDLSPSGDAPNN